VWGTKPVVHLLPHWNWAGQEGKPIDVWAYSNGDSVELFLNGTSLGAKQMPKYGHVNWSVPYQVGKLEARASLNGQVIATDVVETTGPPAALRLSTDRPSIAADGEDASPIKVEVVDAQGRVVPTGDNLVTFATAGPGSVVGVGNGCPSSHEPDKASTRHAFNGLCLVIVGASGSAGAVRVTAKADAP
jgi:beta-galactosidase